MDSFDDWWDAEHGTQQQDLEVSEDETRVDDFDEKDIVDIVI